MFEYFLSVVVFVPQAALKKYQMEHRSKGESLEKCQAELKKLRRKSQQGSKNASKYRDNEMQVRMPHPLKIVNPALKAFSKNAEWGNFFKSWPLWASQLDLLLQHGCGFSHMASLYHMSVFNLTNFSLILGLCLHKTC